MGLEIHQQLNICKVSLGIFNDFIGKSTFTGLIILSVREEPRRFINYYNVIIFIQYAYLEYALFVCIIKIIILRYLNDLDIITAYVCTDTVLCALA